ncbi:unnamed protein product, partial [Ilex paraguariensis]
MEVSNVEILSLFKEQSSREDRSYTFLRRFGRRKGRNFRRLRDFELRGDIRKPWVIM